MLLLLLLFVAASAREGAVEIKSKGMVLSMLCPCALTLCGVAWRDAGNVFYHKNSIDGLTLSVKKTGRGGRGRGE